MKYCTSTTVLLSSQFLHARELCSHEDDATKIMIHESHEWYEKHKALDVYKLFSISKTRILWH